MPEGGIPSKAVSTSRPADQSAINSLTARVSRLQDQEPNVKPTGLVDISGNPLSLKKPDTSPILPEITASEGPSVPASSSKIEQTQSPPESTGNEIRQTAENLAKQQEIMSAISSDPVYQQILGEKVLTAQRTNGNIDMAALKKEALREWTKRQAEEVARETKTQQDVKLGPDEQEKLYKEIFQRAFQEHPLDILRATKQAVELAKAKIDAATLQQDPNIAQEQITKASEAVTELQEKYNLTLEKIAAILPKDSPINILLRDSPGNPELLKFMQKEAKKNLLQLILEFAALIAFPIVDETRKAIIPSLGQQG